MTKLSIKELNREFKHKEPEDVLAYVHKYHPKKYALASSLGVEDQVLTDMICKISSNVSIFVLDTGRLHQKTYDVMEQTMTRYAFEYDVYFPDSKSVEKMVEKDGPNLFYHSVDDRKRCCHIRKTEPLKRALKKRSAWITGLRRSQSVFRAKTQMFEWDETHNMLKVNPLVYWSKDDVWGYIKRYDVPYNELHDKGFASIGCEPCTQPIEPGEDERAGRWWWEDSGKKECGLHVMSNIMVDNNDDTDKGV
jgi:phosphoadenosine phosphosulfate reductase